MDRTVFTEIYEAYFRRVYNYISYRINDHGDVDDLVSQVFERVIEKHHTFDARRGGIEGWIIGIARNMVTDYHRDRARRRTVDIEPLENQLHSSNAQPDEVVIRNEDYRCLIEALGTLSDRERQLIALKYGAELSNRQIARQMGLTISNVGVILFRSLGKLRKHLQKEVQR